MHQTQTRLSEAPETSTPNPLQMPLDDLFSQIEGHNEVTQHLEDLYLCWISSDLADNSSPEERREKYLTIKQLRETVLVHQTLTAA